MIPLADWLPSYQDLLNYVHDALMTVINAVWAFLVATFGGIWTTARAACIAAGSIVASAVAAAQALSAYFNFVNAWVPLDVIITCAVAYSTFWASWFLYKTVKSWIPTLSGGG